MVIGQLVSPSAREQKNSFVASGGIDQFVTKSQRFSDASAEAETSFESVSPDSTICSK